MTNPTPIPKFKISYIITMALIEKRLTHDEIYDIQEMKEENIREYSIGDIILKLSKAYYLDREPKKERSKGVSMRCGGGLEDSNDVILYKHILYTLAPLCGLSFEKIYAFCVDPFFCHIMWHDPYINKDGITTHTDQEINQVADDTSRIRHLISRIYVNPCYDLTQEFGNFS